MFNKFDTEGEKLAYEFMVNWLHWNIAFTEYRERPYAQSQASARVVNAHKKASDDAMLDLFAWLQKRFGPPEDDTV